LYGVVPGAYTWEVKGLPGGDHRGIGLEVIAGEETELVVHR
jgi:hypothetical protein